MIGFQDLFGVAFFIIVVLIIGLYVKKLNDAQLGIALVVTAIITILIVAFV